MNEYCPIDILEILNKILIQGYIKDLKTVHIFFKNHNKLKYIGDIIFLIIAFKV